MTDGGTKPGGDPTGFVARFKPRAPLFLAFLFCVAAIFASGTRPLPRLRIHLVDLSRSVSSSQRGILQEAMRGVREGVALLEAEDRVGVIGFAASARFLLPISSIDEAKQWVREELQGFEVESDDTRVSAAIVSALSQPRQGFDVELVLHTDGAFHDLDLPPLIRSLREEGVRVLGVFTPRSGGSDLRLEELEVPAAIPSGEELPLDVTIRLDGPDPMAARRVAVRVFNQGELLIERVHEHRSGTAVRVALSVGPLSDGLHTLNVRAAFLDGKDDLPENDGREVVIRVGRTFLAWVVLGPAAPGGTSWIEARLANAGFSVVMSPGLPGREEISRVDLVVLYDPGPGLGLSFPDTTRRLAQFVRDGGGGLAVLAGPDSFGPGGWSGTPLETVLPVWARPEDSEPRVLLVVLDVSGSMAEEGKMVTAREAIRLIFAKLDGRDRMGVLPFRDRPGAFSGFLSRGDDGDRERLVSFLTRMVPRGGTHLQLGLERGIDVLREERIEGAHLLVISDGLDEIGEEGARAFSALGDRARGEGASLSVIATGEDVDASLLDLLVDPATGAYYHVKLPSDLFSVLLTDLTRKDQMRADSGDSIAVRAVETSGEITMPDRQGWPSVAAFVRTTKKSGSTALLATFDGDPILVYGRQGSGRSAVFTSRPLSYWAPSYDREHDLFEGVFRWTGARRSLPTRVASWIESKRGRQRCVVELLDCPPGCPRVLEGRWRDRTSQPVTFEMIEPWIYRAELPEGPRRGDLLRVFSEGDSFFGGDPLLVPVAGAPAVEVADPAPCLARLVSLCDRTGGGLVHGSLKRAAAWGYGGQGGRGGGLAAVLYSASLAVLVLSLLRRFFASSIPAQGHGNRFARKSF